jgi:NTE family protein
MADTSSNPPLQVLIEAGAPADVVLVRTMPVDRQYSPPTDAVGLLERTHELTFGEALRQGLWTLTFAQRILSEVPAVEGVLARPSAARVHMIGA